MSQQTSSQKLLLSQEQKLRLSIAIMTTLQGMLRPGVIPGYVAAECISLFEIMEEQQIKVVE